MNTRLPYIVATIKSCEPLNIPAAWGSSPVGGGSVTAHGGVGGVACTPVGHTAVALLVLQTKCQHKI